MTFGLRMFFHGLFGVCFALASILCMRMAGSTTIEPATSTVFAGLTQATDVVAASSVRDDVPSLSLLAEDPSCEDTLALPDRLVFVPSVIDAAVPVGGVPSPCGLPRRPALRPPDA